MNFVNSPPPADFPLYFPKRNDLHFENFRPPADFPLCFPKENALHFKNFPPPADFPLRFPKENDQNSEKVSASGGLYLCVPLKEMS